MSLARQAIYQSFSNANPESVGVYKALEDIYPAFSKKIFQNNKFMELVVMTGYSPMHILEYPICGKCETLAMWDNMGQKDGKFVRACSCFADGCGARTLAPITFKQWLREELRQKAPSCLIENIEMAVDGVALAMMKKTLNEQKYYMKQEEGERKRKAGLIDQYGNEIKNEIQDYTEIEVQEEHEDVESIE